MMTSIIDCFPQKSRSINLDNDKRSLSCTLLWRRNQLLVKPTNYRQSKYTYTLEAQHSLIDCLCHSPVHLIRIDPQLGKEQILFWANACNAANKPIYLCIPKGNKQNQVFNALQQLINSFLACIFLTVLTPLILPLILWMQFYYHQLPITYEWYVGRHGRLFKSIKISTTDINFIDKYSNSHIKFTKIIQKYGVDKIPGLLNVIRGEMILFGSIYLSVADAIKLVPVEQKHLNETPALFSLYS